MDADEGTRLVTLLDVQPGEHVADVGAGDGEWLEPLVDAVGPSGGAIATEVTDELVDELRAFVEGRGWSNVKVVRGDQDTTGLEPGCCDAILLRMVYHHFEDPPTMRADLARALLPGGRLVVVETELQETWSELDGVPDRGGHGIPLSMLIDEMTRDHFVEVERHTGWNGDDDRYAIVFTAVRSPR